MAVEVLVFHPNLAQSTVNKALFEAATAINGVAVRDLYALYPDGNIDIAAEQQRAEAASLIVLQFPIYWFSVPPLLKSWFDDVLQYGWAYGEQGTKLRGKKLLVAASFGGPEESYNSPSAKFSTAQLLSPLQATADYIGTTWLEPFFTFNAMAISPEDLQAQQQAYRDLLSAAQNET